MYLKKMNAISDEIMKLKSDQTKYKEYRDKLQSLYSCADEVADKLELCSGALLYGGYLADGKIPHQDFFLAGSTSLFDGINSLQNAINTMDVGVENFSIMIDEKKSKFLTAKSNYEAALKRENC